MAVKVIPVEEGKEKVRKKNGQEGSRIDSPPLPCEFKLFELLRVFAYSDFVHLQGWEMGKPVKIFMPVVDGSLRDYSSTKMEKKR